MPKVSRRQQGAPGGPRRKGACKDRKMAEHDLERMEARYELLGAKIAAKKAQKQPADKPEEDTIDRDDGLTRSAIKYWWQRLGSCTDPVKWAGVNGVISVIRRKLSTGPYHEAVKGAPDPRTVKHTLERLAEDKDADVTCYSSGAQAAGRAHSRTRSTCTSACSSARALSHV